MRKPLINSKQHIHVASTLFFLRSLDRIHSRGPTMAESNKRAFKKARTSGPIDAKRVKGSPRPLRTKKISKVPSDLQPLTAKAKGKGKEKEVVSKPRLPKLSGEDASHDALPSTFKI